MSKVVELEMARIIGIEIRTALPGGQNTELAILPCNLPIPLRTIEGLPVINMTVHTTEGDLQFGNVNTITPKTQKVLVTRQLAEEMLLEELGRKVLANTPAEPGMKPAA
jgi:hypothetical protein